MNNRYIIVAQEYPESQHPKRTLEVINTPEGMRWAMDQYQRNRAALEWEVIRTERDVDEDPILREVQYGLGTETNEFTGDQGDSDSEKKSQIVE